MDVAHHAWTGLDWMVVPLLQQPTFFGQPQAGAVEHSIACHPNGRS
jgi:hypothetical protein